MLTEDWKIFIVLCQCAETIQNKWMATQQNNRATSGKFKNICQKNSVFKNGKLLAIPLQKIIVFKNGKSKMNHAKKIAFLKMEKFCANHCQKRTIFKNGK